MVVKQAKFEERDGTMRRRVFDLLASLGGLLVAGVLVIAGALLMWGVSYTNSSVHNQLAEQQIYSRPLRPSLTRTAPRSPSG